MYLYFPGFPLPNLYFKPLKYVGKNYIFSFSYPKNVITKEMLSFWLFYLGEKFPISCSIERQVLVVLTHEAEMEWLDSGCYACKLAFNPPSNACTWPALSVIPTISEPQASFQIFQRGEFLISHQFLSSIFDLRQ